MKRKSNYSKNKRCFDCGKSVCNTSIRCHSCRQKYSPANLQDGRTLRKYKCVDCNKLIYKGTFLYKGKRCQSCAIKQNHKLGLIPHPKGKDAYRFKGGKPRCDACGKEVSNYINKRCRKCTDIIKKGKSPKGGFKKGIFLNSK